jgi:hypothetical protein
MTIATLSPTTSDPELLIQGVSGMLIRLQRLLMSAATARWITIYSAASPVATLTRLMTDIQISSLVSNDFTLAGEFAVTTQPGEGCYIVQSSDIGKTEVIVWYDLIPA